MRVGESTWEKADGGGEVGVNARLGGKESENILGKVNNFPNYRISQNFINECH